MKKIRVAETVEDVKSQAKSSDEEKFKEMIGSPMPNVNKKQIFKTLDRKQNKDTALQIPLIKTES